MKPIKVGVIGCGNISDTYFKAGPDYRAIEVVACADISQEAAAAKAAKYGIAALTIDALLADPDIELVINLTVLLAHAEVSLKILAAGKHVYSEKPLAATVAEARQILAAAEQRQLRVGCAPDTFLGGAHQLARKLIDDGAIGNVVGATATFLSPGMESWHPNPEFFFKPGGGPVLDVGPYYIVMLLHLMGPVRRVCASAAISFPERTITSEPLNGTKIQVEVPTYVTGALEFESGALASFTASWDVQRHAHNQLEFYGNTGSLIVPDPNFFGGSPKLANGGPDWVSQDSSGFAFAKPNYTTKSDRPATANYRIIGVVDMAWAIRQDRPHRASADLAFHTLELIEALDRSARHHQHVELESRCSRPAPLPPGAGEDVFARL